MPGKLMAVAAFFLFTPWSITMASDNPYAQRSKTRLPVTLETDRRLMDALTRKSLPDLNTVYAQLHEDVDRIRKRLTDDGTACACDVAHSTLLIIIGFSINKLDGEGRWQDWMEDESLELLENYRRLVAACGEDAGSPAFSGITDEMIKKL